MHPNVRIDVLNKIGKIKKLQPNQFKDNILGWITAMKEKRINIELKLPGAHHAAQFILDIFQGALEAKCKTFVSEIWLMQQKWFLGNPENWTKEHIVSTLIQYYTNMVEDGTWKWEHQETNQIIALTTQVQEIKRDIDRN